ncbi:MAG: hypothetical protein WC807_11115 [Hyphomicrobium sp.]
MANGMQQEKQEKQIPAALREAELMAVVLEGRHGNHAAEVADFFSSLHRHQGDTSRSRAWAGVARLVRRRESDRLLDA